MAVVLISYGNSSTQQMILITHSCAQACRQHLTLRCCRRTAAAWVAARTLPSTNYCGLQPPAAGIHNSFTLIGPAAPGMACRAQGLCALLALCLLLLAAASSASHQACAASEAAAASPAPASAAAGWQRALAADPAGAPAAGPRIFDVSVALDASTPKFNSPDGLGADFRVLEASQAKGDAYTSSLLRLGAHTGEAQLLGACCWLAGCYACLSTH